MLRNLSSTFIDDVSVSLSVESHQYADLDSADQNLVVNSHLGQALMLDSTDGSHMFGLDQMSNPFCPSSQMPMLSAMGAHMALPTASDAYMSGVEQFRSAAETLNLDNIGGNYV